MAEIIKMDANIWKNLPNDLVDKILKMKQENEDKKKKEKRHYLIGQLDYEIEDEYIRLLFYNSKGKFKHTEFIAIDYLDVNCPIYLNCSLEEFITYLINNHDPYNTKEFRNLVGRRLFKKFRRYFKT